MTLPPLYKYLDLRGARLTLGTRAFKHTKPSDFNDREDLTIQSIFPEETEIALKKLANGFTDVILAHLNDPPTCGSPKREMLALIQETYRNNPQAAEIIKSEVMKDRRPVFDVDFMRGRAKEHLAEINAFMQGFRVLCVSTIRDSDAMWDGYAENHRGIALRIEPNLAKDSKYQLFRPVIYRAERPPLYEDTSEFLAGSLFGDQNQRITEIVERILYSKTLFWKRESEYRLVGPSITGGRWDAMPYHPEEVTELYLGAAMNAAAREEIIAMASTINPGIAVFQAMRGEQGQITFVTAPRN